MEKYTFIRTSADGATITVEVGSDGRAWASCAKDADSQTRDACHRVNRDESNLVEAADLMADYGFRLRI